MEDEVARSNLMLGRSNTRWADASWRVVGISESEQKTFPSSTEIDRKTERLRLLSFETLQKTHDEGLGTPK